jgi:hypothetical protein
MGVSISISIKRSLTTLQITQFIVGCLLAWTYLFVTYDIPLKSSQVDLPGSRNSEERTAFAERETKYFETTSLHRVNYVKVTCLDTSGQAFAIWLISVYLFPLTFLFARFYLQAYVRHAKFKNHASTTSVQGSKMAPDPHAVTRS